MRYHLQKTKVLRCLVASAMLGLLTLAPVGEAKAQTGFEFSVSHSDILLDSPDDMIAQKIEAWDSPLLRVVKRSRPFIQVRNTSTNGAMLTQFEIFIGDSQNYEFSDEFMGEYAIESQHFATGILDTVTPSQDNSILTIDFTAGALAMDERALFQVDIDPREGIDGLFVHPDFRMVFFDLFENDNSDNARFTARFDNGQEITSTLNDLNLPADALGSSVFVQGTLRPYDTEEPVDIFGGDPVIPEPSSMALLLAAVFGSCLSRRRRRLG